MNVKQKVARAAEYREEAGSNDFLRRLFYPGLPAAECIGGYVFFPWGTGPTFPIFCDRGSRLRKLSGGAGSQFVEQAGSKFASVVAELAGVSRSEAEKAVAKAAGLDSRELNALTVREVGRRIFEKTAQKGGVKHIRPSACDTVEDYFGKLAKTIEDIDPDRALSDLSDQTGLPREKLCALPLSELGAFLDVTGLEPGGEATTSARTTACIVVQGQPVRCTQLTGWLEGLVWGGIIGGVIGGEVGAVIGAAIGAVIGAIISWLT